jgi:hypothetical protein
MQKLVTIVAVIIAAVALGIAGYSFYDKEKPDAGLHNSSAPTFPFGSASRNLAKNGISLAFDWEGTSSGQFIRGHGTLVIARASEASFEGRSAFAQTGTVTFVGTKGTQSRSIAYTTNTYYDDNWRCLGEISGDGYEVSTPSESNRDSVVVGDTAITCTSTIYADSTKKQIKGRSINSFVVEPDSTSTAPTAIIHLIGNNYDSANALVSGNQLWLRINSSGDVTFLSSELNTRNGDAYKLTFR